MKKIVYLFGILALLASCSNEESYPNSTEPILLKKQVITNSEGKLVINYQYEANKIVSVIDDSGELNLFYTYTGDQIAQIDFKTLNGTVQQVNTFIYNDDGKLASFLKIQSEIVNGSVIKTGYREVYTYTANDEISVQSYRGDAVSQVLDAGTFVIKFTDGNVSEIVGVNASNHKYVFDNKKNFSKNILGMDKIAFADGESNGVYNNEISDIIAGAKASSHSYVYNSEGYPISSTDNENGESYSSEYFY
ncbi:membrane lipoprotein lipid attachment site-containing protein [Flavobacterium sp. LC2016-01]|uniref:membrane lipoprotein lipid attachment site-containing protein n=1 Tax=Flavobacterium sp. LC2016-01 TaxID=2675876 RepID=UPI0012BA8ECB|nr:membrane lipoprotein lipid attachment site-containing protein [Flavobacterium sp. LC2016-01]MTH16425.1 hypothetical protein [Flavobacterium sp. LC2016-01]